MTVLTAKGWSDENGVPGAQATWGAPSGRTVHPSAVAEPSSGGTPSAASAEDPVEIAQGRLRNLDGGLCLDLRAGQVRTGARAELADCSSSASQQWSYRDNGVLRSAVDPTLCLDSDPDEGTVVLAHCLAHAGEVRYDLTIHGELLLRRAERLAVARGKGTGVVVAERDGSEAQRWMLDGGLADVGEQKQETPEKEPRQDTEERQDEKKEQGTAPVEPDRGSPHGAIPDPPGPEPSQGEPEDPPQSQYETRYVQDDSGGEPAPATPVDTVVALPADVSAIVSTVAGTATSTLDSALR